jgi:hypothetical protein
MSAIPAYEKERQSLKAVISSERLSRAPTLTKLLTHLCEAYFEGRTGELKEYSIATDTLGLPPDCDENDCAIVRVQMHRLRVKLNEYYEHEGICDPVRIVLKPGVYSPEFVCVPSPTVASPPPEGRRLDPPLPRRTGADLRVERWALGLGISLAVGAVLLTAGFWRRGSPSASVPTSWASASTFTERPSFDTTRVSPEGGIRILPGSDKPSAIDAFGNIWQGDRYYNGGEAQATPPALLNLTSDPALFETYRQGNFSYKIPLAPGLYELHLYFADSLASRSDFHPKQVPPDFMVLINGKDHWAHQGHPLVDGTRLHLETEKVFKDISPAREGSLVLNFKPNLNSAFINAISVIPTPDGKAQPIRIVAQQKSQTDQHGQIWLSDRYFTDGYLAWDGMKITGTSDPKLFAGNRLGNFQYVIPVAESSYTVKLYFVETWFGKGGQPGGGVGSRVFQVDCNGKHLLRHFDVLAEAGARGSLLVKTFRGITPDEEGHIVLSFIPIEDIASVNAVEITDERGGFTQSATQR